MSCCPTISRVILVSILWLMACPQSRASEQMDCEISKLWNDITVAENETIGVHLEVVRLTTNASELFLKINISAPFYDDPKLPPNITVGSTDQLWNYEVVEVFLLGADNRYLEIELGPKGHYLLLQLHGYRNVTQTGLTLDHYSTRIDGNRWTGTALIPHNYLPQGLNKFNAYAIHGSDADRRYLALFPTPNHKYKDPDFHRLDYFGDFSLKIELI